jgi:hypothetical protein
MNWQCRHFDAATPRRPECVMRCRSLRRCRLRARSVAKPCAAPATSAMPVRAVARRPSRCRFRCPCLRVAGAMPCSARRGPWIAGQTRSSKTQRCGRCRRRVLPGSMPPLPRLALPPRNVRRLPLLPVWLRPESAARTTLELLTAEGAALQATTERIQARLEQHLTRLTLLAASGALTSAQLDSIDQFLN